MKNHQTYYSKKLDAALPRPSLEGLETAEICIVGAGLAGLTTALELCRAGRSVVVLDAQTVAYGASGRNGGFVGPGWSRSLDLLERAIGPQAAHSLYRLSQEGVAIVADNIAGLNISGIEMAAGKLSCARTPSRDALRARRDRLEAQFGVRAELWEPEQVRAALRSPRYFEALHFPDDFQINPLAYARGLATEIERLGGRIFEHSPVLGGTRQAGSRSLRTERGRVNSEHVVLACGGYTERWAKPLHQAYIPISTYVMLSESNPDLLSEAVRTPFAVGDQRRAGDYYRLVEGGNRLLWGGRITTRVSEPHRLANLLRRTMVSTFPQLEGLEIDLAWSGRMAYARHLMPQIGPVEPGLWSCTAFGGHGLNTTAIGGKVVAEAILGRSDRWQAFSPFGFQWAGGIFGRMAAQSTYWWLQARDSVSEAFSQLIPVSA